MRRDLMATRSDAALREHVVEVLTGGHAHATFEQAVKDLPVELRGKVPKGGEYSAWQLLEHLRIAQLDILEFSRDAKHESPKWPEGLLAQGEGPGEGPLKLTGAARYAAADHRPDGVLHAVLVGAPVAAGAGCAVSTPRRRGSCPASRPS